MVTFITSILSRISSRSLIVVGNMVELLGFSSSFSVQENEVQIMINMISFFMIALTFKE
ncbi:hypothetical protein D3C87_2075780 [compost metagenome]